MIQRIPAALRHTRDFGWLKTAWLFSFDDYHDPDNVQFSALRVFNDDIIAPHAGFPLHGHKEMEIVTVMLAGELTHEDSLGNKATIRAGDIQRMTAGRGIRHAEFNHGEAPVHLYQLWIEPTTTRLMPAFEEYHFLGRAEVGGFEPLVSGRGGFAAPLSINADVVISRCALKTGDVATCAAAGRSVFFYLTSGVVRVNGETVHPGDQLRVSGETALTFEGVEPAAGLLVDLPG